MNAVEIEAALSDLQVTGRFTENIYLSKNQHRKLKQCLTN